MRRFRKTGADDELAQLRQGKVTSAVPLPPKPQITESNPILSSHFDQDASLLFNPLDNPTLHDMKILQREYEEDDEAIGSYVFKVPGVQTTSCTRLTSTVTDDVADPDVEATVHLPASTFTSNVKRQQSSASSRNGMLITSSQLRLSDAPLQRKTLKPSTQQTQQQQASKVAAGTSSKLFGRDIYGKAAPVATSKVVPMTRPPTSSSLNLRKPSEESLVVRTSYAESGGAIKFCSCGRCVDLSTLAAGSDGAFGCPHCGGSFKGTSVMVHNEPGKPAVTTTRADPKEAAQLLREIEAREALEFKKAVEEWRRGGPETGGDVAVVQQEQLQITASCDTEVKGSAVASVSVGPTQQKKPMRSFPIPKPTYFSHLWSCVDSNDM